MQPAAVNHIFFADRSLGKKTPQGLRAMGWTVEIQDERTEPCFADITIDINLFPEVAQRNWIFITKDTRILRVAAERDALLAARLRYFGLESYDSNAHEMIEAFLHAGPEIFRILGSTPAPIIGTISLNPCGEVTIVYPKM